MKAIEIPGMVDNLKQHGHTDKEIEATLVQKLSDQTWLISAPMMSKRFIAKVLIEELKNAVQASPWNAFVAIGCGIEFLGKCIDDNVPYEWDKEGSSAANFRDAIFHLKAFEKYAHLNQCRGMNAREVKESGLFDLYTEFRCGFAHGYGPKLRVAVSSGDNEDPNLHQIGEIVNFNVAGLYQDFANACQEVISRSFPDPRNKMNLPRLWINRTVNLKELKTHSTQSKA